MAKNFVETTAESVMMLQEGKILEINKKGPYVSSHLMRWIRSLAWAKAREKYQGLQKKRRRAISLIQRV